MILSVVSAYADTMNHDFFAKRHRKRRLAWLIQRNRDERINELEALTLMHNSLYFAAQIDPEAWDRYQQLRRRIPILRRFLGLPPKP
jgi:hypothetical protein